MSPQVFVTLTLSRKLWERVYDHAALCKCQAQSIIQDAVTWYVSGLDMMEETKQKIRKEKKP